MKYLMMVLCVGVVCLATGAQADEFKLQDDAGNATVNLPGVTGGQPATGPAGMNALERNDARGGPVVYDRIDDLTQHWWWLGLNNGAARPIHDFRAGATTGTAEFLDSATNQPASPANAVEFTYTATGTKVNGRYQLDGGAVGDWSTSLARSLTVQNTSGAYQTYRLYSMSDLALTYVLDSAGGPGPAHFSIPSDEQAAVTGPGQITQWDVSLHGTPNIYPMTTATTTASSVPLRGDIDSPGIATGPDGAVSQPDLDLILQSWAQAVGVGNPADLNKDGFVGQADLDVVLQNWASVGPLSPTAVQVAFNAGGGGAALIGAIQAGNNLDGTTAQNPAGQQTGEEIAFAYQWTFTLAPGGSFTVHEDVDIIPEPASLALLGIGAALLVRRTRRA